MVYECEVRLVRDGKKLGLLTTMHVFAEDEARRMAEAGAEIIVGSVSILTFGSLADTVIAHMGLTIKGCKPLIIIHFAAYDLDVLAIGAKTGRDSIPCIPVIEGIVGTIRAIAPASIIFVYGGPIAELADAEYILTHITV